LEGLAQDRETAVMTPEHRANFSRMMRELYGKDTSEMTAEECAEFDRRTQQLCDDMSELDATDRSV